MAVQSDYRYSLTVNGSSQFEVVRFVLKEHLSTLFRLELDLASFGAEPNFNCPIPICGSTIISSIIILKSIYIHFII